MLDELRSVCRGVKGLYITFHVLHDSYGTFICDFEAEITNNVEDGPYSSLQKTQVTAVGTTDLSAYFFDSQFVGSPGHGTKTGSPIDTALDQVIATTSAAPRTPEWFRRNMHHRDLHRDHSPSRLNPRDRHGFHSS